MTYKIKKAFFFILTVLGSANVYGQDNLYFKRLGIEQGLSLTAVMHIVQDNYGFIWIGTEQGLNIYDGYSFKVFIPEEGKNSIVSSHIFYLSSDKNGDFWIGTSNGLSKYNRIKNKFTNYVNTTNSDTSIPIGRITGLYNDSHDRLWMGTESGISFLDKMTNKFTNFPYLVFGGKKVEVSQANHIIEDANGNLYFSTPFNGLFHITKSGHVLERWSHTTIDTGNRYNIINGSVEDFLIDKKGRLWLATVIGLERINLKTGEKNIWRNDPNDRNSLSSIGVTRLFQDMDGKIWVGTDNGLNLYNEKNNNFKVFRKEENNLQSLGGNNITNISEDRDGNLWIGTYDGGVTCIFHQQKAFETYRHQFNDEKSLSNNAVISFEKDSKNSVWVGTNGGGLNKLDPVEKTFKSYSYIVKNPTVGLSSNAILGIALDSLDKIWVGTYADGYNYFDPVTEKSIQFFYTKEHPYYPSHGPIFSICYDKKRKCIWLGTFNDGLNKMDIVTRKVEKYKYNSTDSNSVAGNIILSIKEDENGILWMAALSGLYAFDPETKKFRNWKVQPGKKFGIHNDDVGNITLAKDRIWFATDKGVEVFDKKTEHFRNFDSKDGLPDDFVNSVEIDNHGNAWASTNKGLSCLLCPKEGFIIEKSSKEQPVVVKNYDFIDGLQGNEFNQTASYKDNEGNLYFGGMNGFTIVHPELLKDNLFVPPVYLTDFKLFNKSIEPGDSLHLFEKSITFADKVNLTYKQNFFSISFTAFNYKNPDRIIYQYCLDGFDENWVTVSADKRFATYTNLDPGNYKFRVRASMDGLHWSEKEASVDIDINPPFWKTIPFRAATLIFLVILIVGSVRFYLERNFKKKLALLERQQEVARIRGRIARDIHDNIGAELTRISLLTEVARIENPGINHTSFTKLSDASREITGQLGEIVWSVNPLHDNLISMLSYMRNYILHFLEETDVHCEIDIPEEAEEKIIHPEVRRNLFLILKEALNNTIKYAGAKNIFVTFLITGDNYVMKIVDDGKGMDMGVRPTGNGLINMQNRMDTIGGDMHIISYPGKGTTIIAEGKLF